VNGTLITEALDALFAIRDAILAWIAVGAAAVTIVLFTLVITGAWTWRAIRRAAIRPSWGRGRFRARTFARRRTKRPNEPTEPRAYQEAA
jgi:hypothetical protein